MTLFDTTSVGLAADLRSQVRAPTYVRADPWTSRMSAGLVAALLAVAALAFARWQYTLSVVPWDSKNHFYPMFRFLGDALRHGTVPLWNPYVFSGYPGVADPQSLIFTPSLAVLAFLVPHASMPAFDGMILAHLVLGAVGMLGLCRRWGWHPAAALLAALVFMYGGSASSRLQHTGMIISYSFFPLALWSLHAALDRRSLRVAAVAGIAAALMALGRDQVAYLLCLTLCGSVLWQALRSPNAIDFLRSRAPVLALAAFVTVSIMIVPVLLTLQFLQGSNRPDIAYGMALAGSLNPVNLLTLFAPNAFGSLDRVYDYWGPGAATLAGNDWTDRTIDYLYIGTLPVVLFAWHGLAGGRIYERGARFFALIVVAALLYAVGRFTPFFSAAFDWWPGVDLYRRPADATFVVNIGLAFLGGSLLHRFVVEGLPRRRLPLAWALLVAAGLASGSAWLLAWGLKFAERAAHTPAALATLAIAAALSGAVAAALYLGRHPNRRRLVAYALVGATGAQLVWYNAASPLNAEPASTYSAYDGFYPDQRRGLEVLRPELAAREARGEHPRMEILGLDGSWENASMVLKFENTVGYNPLRIADYERDVGVAESSSDPKLRTFPDTFRGYNSRLAALLGLDYLVLDRPLTELPRHIPRPRGTLMFAGNHFYIYRLNCHSAPRVYLAARVKAVDGTFPPFEVGQEALVDQRDIGKLRDRTLLEAKPDAVGSHATIKAYGDNDIVVDVDAATTSVLVLHDLDYPGWEARVDGAPTPILRTNLLFRGVEVSPGHHTVEFSFHPFSLANLTAAAAGLLHEGDR